MKVSVIVPFVNEFPQIVFTLRSIYEELLDRVDFEIIAIDNFCKEVEAQGRPRDRGSEHLKTVTAQDPRKWLKYMEYDGKLSHWQAKNIGVKASTGDVLWFCDAHCIVSRDALVPALNYCQKTGILETGTLHLPLTYQILEWRKLVYALVVDREKYSFAYRFCSFPNSMEGKAEPFEVPAMSTCGVIMSRKMYDRLGGWPKELGIYSGGEHFINFTLATMGLKKWVWPGPPLCHHGDKRGYSWNSSDYTRNRAIANFMFGGRSFMLKSLEHMKGHQHVLRRIGEEVPVKCAEHRELIKKQQTIDIFEWEKSWRGKEFGTPA